MRQQDLFPGHTEAVRNALITRLSVLAIRLAAGEQGVLRHGLKYSCHHVCQDYIEMSELIERVQVMSGKSPSKTKFVGNVSWVNYQMTKDDIRLFEAWDAETNQIAEALVNMVGEGYRLSFSYDQYKKSVQCAVTCVAEKSANIGKGFSSWAKSWEKLVALTVFKHYFIFHEVWPDSVPRPDFADFG